MDFPYQSQNLGRLEQVRRMNKSGNNEVYLVINRENNQRYVLRKMKESGAVYSKLMEIESQHLPKVYEVVEQEGYSIVLEEYVYGDGLDFLLAGGPLTPEECRPIMAGLCDILTVLHQQGIVHRDIKPENIIIHGDVPVLVDFDASRLHKDSENSDTVVLGTTGYAAPEQYGISQTDHRTDLYAMGVLLNFMLIGKHPSTALAPGGAGRIVRKCTMMKQNQGFQSAEQLKSGLRTLSRPGRTGMILGGVAVLAVVLVAAVLLWPKSAEAEATVESTEASVLEEQSQKEEPLQVSIGTRDDMMPENSTAEIVSAAQETAEKMGVRVEEVMGFYSALPENLDSRITDFQFVVSEENPTVYFVYPGDLYGDPTVDVQCFIGGEEAVVAPTSQNVLDAATFGEPVPTDMDGFFCVPITFDQGFSGEGNLHMNIFYASGSGDGGNIFVYSQDALMQEQPQTQEPATSGERMGFYGGFPTEDAEELHGQFLATEENRTLWLLYSELWQGQPCQGLEVYLGNGSDGPPEPSDPELVEHLTIGEPEPSDIAGCVCVPITVDETYVGTGNLHINLNFGESGLIGGNVFITQE